MSFLCGPMTALHGLPLTSAGKLTFTVLAAIAELERKIIRERVKSGRFRSLELSVPAR